MRAGPGSAAAPGSRRYARVSSSRLTGCVSQPRGTGSFARLVLHEQVGLRFAAPGVNDVQPFGTSVGFDGRAR